MDQVKECNEGKVLSITGKDLAKLTAAAYCVLAAMIVYLGFFVHTESAFAGQLRYIAYATMLVASLSNVWILGGFVYRLINPMEKMTKRLVLSYKVAPGLLGLSSAGALMLYSSGDNVMFTVLMAVFVVNLSVLFWREIHLMDFIIKKHMLV